ncbi:unnamed protein product [Litomosoides sigmodontis]|uniref:Uncharacterized protein n=1 Tax=Litomosoides sigmodontis TaxID=42156 RepID=A0A3P7K9K2_LITSI|nr:unnamed protein product [Litomosoides sigmodontis]
MEENDKETLNDDDNGDYDDDYHYHHHHHHRRRQRLHNRPYCSSQQQMNEGDEIKLEEKHSVDKMILLHQALSQASVTRAKRCKQVLSYQSFFCFIFSKCHLL